jgi:site-specific DNA recombinase
MSTGECNTEPSGEESWCDRTTVWAVLKYLAYKGQGAFGKMRVGDRRACLRPLRGALEQPRWAYSTYEVPPEQWTYIPVPAIIGEGLFEAAQERLAENRNLSVSWTACVREQTDSL